MHKFSYKTLFIIFFFLLIGVVILFRFIFPNQKVSAAWWNDSWIYRKAVSVTNASGSNLTDFQVSLSVGTSALIASGKMKSDCSDIRITDQNGNLLPYWIEENNPGCNQVTDTKIWTKVPSISTSGATIFVYYDNPSATSVQKGSQVFEFFDDFNNNNIGSLWSTKDADNENNTSFNEINQRLQIGAGGADTWTATDHYGSVYTQITGDFVAEVEIISQTNTNDWAKAGIMMKNNMNQSGSSTGYVFMASTPSNARNFQYDSDNNGFLDSNASGGGATPYPNYLRIIKSGQTFIGFSSNDNLSWSQIATTTLTSTNTTQDLGLSVTSHSVGVTSVVNFDNIKVRKYASTDPTTTLQSEELSPAPIAYWKFDEGVGTTAYDSSSSKNNGIITGATWIPENQCISGKCLDFNGTTQFINIADNPSLDIANEITLSAWIYWHGGGGDHNIITKESAYEIMVNNGYITFAINPWNWEGGTSAPISQNKWEYVVITHDSDGQQKIYINGIQKFSQNSGGAITTNSDIVTIGARGAGTFSFFNGLIDEVKIYPYARTAAQIKLDYNSRGSSKGSSVNLGVQSNTAPDLNSKLIAYWKFDEGYGTIANNSVNGGSALNMTFTAGKLPTWTNNGKVNKSLSFSTSQIELTDYTNSPLDTPNGVTFSLWAYPTTLTSDRYLMYKWGAYSLAYGDSTCGNGKFGLSVYGIGGARVWVCALSTSSLNNWYHITGSVTPNGKVNIYINGVLNNSSNFPYSAVDVSDSKLTYGDYEGGGYAFSGLIDEAKIYNTALTADEIKQDYNQGSAIVFGSTNQTIGGTTTSLDYCIPGDTSPCSAPIAEWKMDEKIGTSIVDTSGNNNTGTLGTGNSAPTWTQGKIGGGLNFNGTSDIVNIGNPSILNFGTNSFTYSLWVNVNTSNGAYDMPWFKGGSSVGITGYDLELGTDGWEASLSDGTVTKTVSFGNETLNQWVFLSTVIDRANNKLYAYKNGSLVNSTDITGFGSISSNYSAILSSPSYHFKGKMDQFRIYNYARTPAQVAYDYNKGGPVGWWKFDECQGNIAYDWSGIGNTGTIIIGASGTQNSLGTCQVGTSAAWTNGTIGKINSSLNFDGTDDYISINNNDSLNLTQTGGTVSLWFKTNVSASGSINGSLVAKTISYSNGYWFTKYNDKLRISLYGTSNLELVGNKSITDNIWHHAVATWTSDTLSIYVDGILDKSQGYAFTFSTSTDPLYIARMWQSGEGYFQGQIDDVRIYNYALTLEQIKVLYNGGAVNFN